ncbi:NUDIX domain-containing protein [Candidatus Daviesbacteria bacterium]|nr:NUDIX domain-containing protein [Candidatus Daviesbacteria bacterium]
MGQTILACDDQGNFLEYIPKEIGHTGAGRRHLAITVLIYNSKGEVLLQKRRHQVFNNVWDFTASTHPLHQNNTDETFEQASKRALKDEYDIENVSLKIIGEFNYFAKNGEFCENEHCALMTGKYDGPFKLNPEVGYECIWMGKEQFLEDLDKNPQKYGPWVISGAKFLKQKHL